MPKNPTIVGVVAVALIGDDRRVLMQRRRLGKAHGGLWEFPGGKIEPGETPACAAIREIAEELGVGLAATALEPVSFAADDTMTAAGGAAHLILLYRCHRWQGNPLCLDAEENGWFAPADLAALAMPPLDYPLARALVGQLGAGI